MIEVRSFGRILICWTSFILAGMVSIAIGYTAGYSDGSKASTEAAVNAERQKAVDADVGKWIYNHETDGADFVYGSNVRVDHESKPEPPTPRRYRFVLTIEGESP